MARSARQIADEAATQILSQHAAPVLHERVSRVVLQAVLEYRGQADQAHAERLARVGRLVAFLQESVQHLAAATR